MRTVLRIFVPFLFAGLMLPAQLLTQELAFEILSIDNSNWPTVSVQYLLTDEEGNSIRADDPSEFAILENGQPVINIRRDCPPDPDPTPIDAVLVSDQSLSMQQPYDETGDPRMNLVHLGANSFIETLKPALDAGTANVAATAFDRDVILLQDFTSSFGRLAAAINSLSPVSWVGTNYEGALMDPDNGAIPLLSPRPTGGGVKRAVVFLTDGACVVIGKDPCFEAFPIWNEAVDNNIPVYAIALGFTMGDSLIAVAENSGGAYYENVITEEEIKAVYRQIAETIQGFQPCTLTWTSEVGCDEESRDRDVQITYLPRGQNDNIKYKAPRESVARTVVDPTVLSFGNPDPGVPIRKVFKVTIGEVGFRIQDLRLEPDTQTHFKITGVSINGGAFEDPENIKDEDLLPGFEIEVEIEFEQDEDREFHIGEAIFDALPCPIEKVVLWGGGAVTGETEVRVIARESNSACDGVDIKWFTNPIERKMTLEYSDDGGTSWNLITDEATGGAYIWENPPIGQGYLIRARALGEFGQWEWVRDEGAAGADLARAIDTDKDGSSIVIGSYTGDVEFGEFGETDFVDGGGDFIARYLSDGTLDWANKSQAIIQTSPPTGRQTVDALDVAVDFRNGEYYVIGNEMSTVSDGNPAPNIRRYDINGFQMPAQGREGGKRNEFIEEYVEVDVGTDGNAYVLANGENAVVGNPGRMYVEQFAPSLNRIWNFSDDSAPKADGVSGRNLAVGINAFAVSGLVEFDGNTYGLGRGNFLAKYKGDGSLEWSRSLPGSSADGEVVDADLTMDNDGNVYVIGTYTERLNFRDGSRALNTSGGGDLFVAKFASADGRTLWATRAVSASPNTGNDEGRSIAVDQNGQVYITGWFEGGRLDLENASGTGTEFQLANTNRSEVDPNEVFVAKYDDDGNVVWATSGGGDRGDKAAGIAVDGQNLLYLAGTFAEGVGAALGNPTFGDFRLAHRGSGDVFVAKIRGFGEGEDIGDDPFNVDAPIITLDPDPIDVGSVPVGQSITIRVKISNGGSWPLRITEHRIEGADPDDFLINGMPDIDDPALTPEKDNPDDFVEIDVVFTPDALGERRAVLVIKGDCADSVFIDLIGIGDDPCLAEIDSPLEIDSEIGQTTSKTFPCAFRNTFDRPVTLNITLRGVSRGLYQITSQNPVVDLAPDGCYDLEIDFLPVNADPILDVVVDYGVELCDHNAILRGTGIPGDATIAAETMRIGPLFCWGDEPKDTIIVITNPGNGVLELTSGNIPPGDHGFSIHPDQGFPVNIPSGESREVQIRFDPDDYGKKRTLVTFEGNANNKAEGIVLCGSKEIIEFSFDPDPLNFGPVPGNQPEIRDLVITNTGSSTATLVGIGLPPPFVINTQMTGEELEPGESITIKVEFPVTGDKELHEQDLNLSYTPFCDPAVVRVSGIRAETAVDLTLPVIDADVHATDFPLRITMTPGDNYELLNDNIEARAFEITVRLNARLFLTSDDRLAAGECIGCTSEVTLEGPDGNTPPDVEEWRTIKIIGTAPEWNPGEAPIRLINIVGTVLLGNVNSSVIQIVDVDWPGVGVTANEGELILDEVCREGGDRLLQRTNAFSLGIIAPNPAVDKVSVGVTTMETGAHVIEIYNSQGKMVYRSAWEESARSVQGQEALQAGGEWIMTVSTAELANGLYQVVLRSPSQVARQTLVIAK